MRHIGLFEGIGGFSLAARWMGWETIAWSEISQFCQRILKYHFPEAKAHGDINTTDFTIYKGICDIVSGGFPCQPYSTAGKRLGKNDARHLWPQMFRAIKEIRPRWVVGENVRGIISWNDGLVFDEVQSDLESEGYEILPLLLPACSVNAPHKRERVWFVAYRADAGIESMQKQKDCFHGFNSAPHTTSERERSGEQSERNEGRIEQLEITEPGSNSFNISEAGFVTNTGNAGLQGRKLYGAFNKEGQERREQSPGSVAELHKINYWRNFPTQSPVCGGNDGIPRELDGITFSKWRNESLKAYGNAIVPQVAYQIFKVINEMERAN